MKEPVSHVERPPLPWRSGQSVTECGLDVESSVTVTRAEFVKRMQEWGIQRTSLMTCMTCLRTAERWLDWDSDPRQAICREAEWEGYGRYRGDKRGSRLRDELRAVAALIAAHPDEFKALVDEIAAKAAWKERLAEKAKRA